MSIRVYRTPVPKDRLAAMPKEERTLLILLGHAENELNTLIKLIVMAGNGTSSDEVIQHAEASQILVLMRLLIGKLQESWELLRTRFLCNRQLAGRYLPKLSDEAQQALDELKRTFGGSGLFAALRNHHVFHFPSDEVVEEAFQRLPDADKWEFFISHMVANSYYHLSEMIVGLAMMRGVDQDDPAAGFEKIGALTIKVADKFRDFFGECISAIMEERVASESDQLQMVEVADPPKLSVVAIPFYIDDSELPTPSN